MSASSQMLSKYVTAGAKCVNFHSIWENLILKREEREILFFLHIVLNLIYTNILLGSGGVFHQELCFGFAKP